MKVSVSRDVFQLAEVWSRTEAQVLTVVIEDGGARGWGECVPYARYGETLESVTAQIEALPERFDRADLQGLLPAGAARNAVDCALWDLEAKQAGKRVWELAGLAQPKPVVTAFTLSLGEPDAMRASSEKNAHRPLLKIKLGGDGDLARLEAVRRGAPEAEIIVDANEGWSVKGYEKLAPAMLDLGVTMVEQPLPAGEDSALLGMDRPLPVCADESCHDRGSLGKLIAKYDMVNIKLDKTGGLTEALALRDAAVKAGYGVMVGCMVGSSLAMAPAVLVAQGATVVDLDGPLLLAEDRDQPLKYNMRGVHASAPGLWG